MAPLTLVASTVVQAAPAAAADAPYRVDPGLIFNNIKGSKAQQEAILRHVHAAIDNAPRGSRIRIAQYLFDIQSSADKLLEAHKRGVGVQMLIDDNGPSAQTTQVRKALGTDQTKRSYVATCKRGCMSSQRSVQHAKFFLFSRSGESENVSMISSANLYTGNTYTSWNNVHTLVGDTKVYGALNRYFDDMRKDKDNPNYYRTVTSGDHKLYFFPSAGKDPFVDILQNVRCTGAAPGYGNKGRTVIRVAQWGWSAARLEIARQLWRLHDKGCIVQVLYNNGEVGPRVPKELLRKSKKYGVMRVDNAQIDTGGKPGPDVYLHHKVLAISGVWFNRPNTKVVYTGSQNFSGPGLRQNNEVTVRIKGAAVHDAYVRNIDHIRKDWSERVTTPPSPA